MVRLNELLERIRPAGAPGAPTEGDVELRTEVASITIVVAEFESEAQALIATARAEAARLLDDGRRSYREMAATRPDHVAVAEAEAARVRAALEQSDGARLRTEADQTIATLLERAEVQIPTLVTEALDIIWAQVAPEPTAEPLP